MKKIRKILPPLLWKRFFYIAFLLGLAIMLIAGFFNLSTIFAYVGMAIISISFLSGIIFWRCPTCGRVLPPRAMIFVEYCPYCSYSLRDEIE